MRRGVVPEREPPAILPGSIGSIAIRSRGGTMPRCIRRQVDASEVDPSEQILAVLRKANDE